MTDLKRFEYVLALSESLNFSRAAANLHISQSTLSQYIQKLEDEIGFPLFDRTSSVLCLTEYGKVYVRGARSIIEIYTETLDGIRDADSGVSGTLKVGVPPSRAPYVLPFVLKKYKALYPAVKFEFSEIKSGHILESLDSGEIDFAYMVRLTDTDGYIRFPVEEEETMLICSKDSHRLDGIIKADTVDFRDLANTEFIIVGNKHLVTEDFYSLCSEYGIAPPAVITVSELSTAASLAKNDLGVTLLPSSYINYDEIAKDINFIKIKGERKHRTISIVYKKEKYLGKAARKFIEILKTIPYNKRIDVLSNH